MNILDIEFDDVVSGLVAIGSATYSYTYEKLIPLIDTAEFQRKLQDVAFYKKLERDFVDGCVIPPITVAFVTNDVNKDSTKDNVSEYINNNINNAFVLDGIQRLNTLSRIQEKEGFDHNKKMYINYIFCESIEKLLYRMITLNNGQRPMTPRHQVEAIMRNLFDFNDIGISVVSEKDAQKGQSKTFKKADIVQAYLAFMADKAMIDNKKIISEKMDELLVKNIMSDTPSNFNVEFKTVLYAIKKFQEKDNSSKWLLLVNNLVGFSVGMRHSSDEILEQTAEQFSSRVEIFESAFKGLNTSKIKVGKIRRELSCEYFTHFNKYKDLNEDDLLECFSEFTA